MTVTLTWQCLPEKKSGKMMTRSRPGVAETTRGVTPGVTQMRPQTTTLSSKVPGRAALRARNRAFVAEINARTVCAHCGAQPVEWHNSEHVLLKRQNWRIARLVWAPAGLQMIKDEIARCTPLCRRCHMREDGRLAGLLAARPRQPGVRFPVSPCMQCDRPYTPLRRGLCRRCYDHRRRLRSQVS